MECKKIIELMEQMAPAVYACDWDNVGLLVGRDNKDVKKIMVALDCTDSVISQAIKQNVDLLITHHPLIFKPIKRVNYNDYVGRKIYKLAVNDICYFAAHTNMDVSYMADKAAKMLDMVNTKPLEITYEKKMYKIVVFVPETAADKVRDSMTKEGAGFIGNYSHCTYNVDGVGTYMAREGCQPYIGSINELTKTREIRIECTLTEENIDRVVKAMLKVHPYEEVAYDIYELTNNAYEKGIGKIGYLDDEMTLKELAQLVKDRFGVDYVTVSGDMDKKVVKAAISPGAGKSMVSHALKAGVDVLITGDMDHHSVIDALDQGLCIIDASHFGTEHFVVEDIKDYLIKNVTQNNDDIFSDGIGVSVVKANEVSPFMVV